MEIIIKELSRVKAAELDEVFGSDWYLHKAESDDPEDLTIDALLDDNELILKVVSDYIQVEKVGRIVIIYQCDFGKVEIV